MISGRLGLPCQPEFLRPSECEIREEIISLVRDQVEGRYPLGQSFQGNRRFDYCETFAEAEVNTSTKCNVGAGIIAVDIESFRIVEQGLVVVGGAE